MTRVSNRTLIFYILAGFSLVLLILSSSGRDSAIEGTLGRVARPFLLISNGIGKEISESIAMIREMHSMRARNEALEAQVNTLTIDNLRVRELESENERLRELLRFRQLNPSYDFRGGQVIARVISEGPSNYLRTIGIDLGSEQGIERGMPVVTESGLVGRIDRVRPDSSTVLLIIDPRSKADAQIERNRVVGVLQGLASGGLSMDYISQDADVSLGDLVKTSGLGGGFPKGLIIGQVVAVRQRDYEMFQQATVRPTVNFDRLEWVLVITNFRPSPGQPDELEPVG
jgi:rod shape-determining protein MreC